MPFSHPHPAEPPQKVTLEGRFVRIEPLDPERHGRHLWQEMDGHDALWDYMAYGPFEDQAVFQAGMFASGNSATRLRSRFTLERLYDAFGVPEDE